MPESRAQETVLWLLRHPEPEGAAAGRCYGSLDFKLSDVGIRHAECIASALAGEPVAAIYTSPRQRCQQAAQILAASRSCPVEILDALRELDFGEFEGRSYEEVAQRHPGLYRQWMEHPTDIRFPGGESFAEMSGRVIQAAKELRARHAGHTIVLVTHGGVNRILLADALGIQPANVFRLGQRYGAINRIRYFGEIPHVELVNAVGV
jgi:alpha-ribazole phosphatase